jgi:hypothetical protein
MNPGSIHGHAVTWPPMKQFFCKVDATPHVDDSGAHMAVHLPVVLFSDGERSMGVDIASAGKLHRLAVTINFLDPIQQRVSYSEWLAAWSPALINVLMKMETDPAPFDDTLRSQLKSNEFGLDISVRTEGRPALADHVLLWEPAPKEGQPHYFPSAYSRKCCPAYRLVGNPWSGKAMLQDMPRRRQPDEEP